MSDRIEKLEARLVELSKEVDWLYEVLGDAEDALASGDALGAASELSRLRPQAPNRAK